MSASVLKRLVPKMPEVQYLKAFTDISLCAVSKIAEIASSGMMRPCETVTKILDELGKCVLSWLKELWVVGGSSYRGHTHAVGGKKELEASLCHILLILVSSSQTYGHFAHTHFAISLPKSAGYVLHQNLTNSCPKMKSGYKPNQIFTMSAVSEYIEAASHSVSQSQHINALCKAIIQML